MLIVFYDSFVGQVMGDSLLEGEEEEEEEEEVDPGPPQIDPATGQVIPRPKKKKKRRGNKLGRRKLLENLSTKPTDFQVTSGSRSHYQHYTLRAFTSIFLTRSPVLF